MTRYPRRQILGRRAHDDGTAAEIFYIKTRLREDIKALSNSCVIYLVERNGDRLEKELAVTAALILFELFKDDTLMRRVLIYQQQLFIILLENYICTECLADVLIIIIVHIYERLRLLVCFLHSELLNSRLGLSGGLFLFFLRLGDLIGFDRLYIFAIVLDSG